MAGRGERHSTVLEGDTLVPREVQILLDQGLAARP
jgi:hypothetical protein